MNTRFATQYNKTYDRSAMFATVNVDASMTNQADAKDTDINIIMKRYAQTGQLPRQTASPAEGGDFTEVGDYRACLDRVKHAQEKFNELPSALRKKFANDPANLIEFLGDPANQKEAEKLGLLVSTKTPLSADAAALRESIEKLGENFNANAEPERPSGRGKKHPAPPADPEPDGG